MANPFILPAPAGGNAFQRSEITNSMRRGRQTFRCAAESFVARGGCPRYLDRVIAYFGDTMVDDIVPIDVYDMANHLYPGRKNATKNRQGLSPARAVLHHAYERGWRSRIVLRRFKEEPPKRKVPANAAWLHAFSRQCQRDDLQHLSALVLFMFTTGARVSEAIRLCWREVDLTKRQAVLLKTKTSTNSVRWLTDEMISRLHALKESQEPDERVFRYVCRQSVNQRIKAVCERAEIRPMSSHACGRVSFANNLIEMGVDIKTIMIAGDWRSIVVFMGTYVRGRTNAGRLVAERFGQYDFSAAL